MDYVVNHWQEFASIAIVIITVALFIKREIDSHDLRKNGICSQDKHCAVAKIRALHDT